LEETVSVQTRVRSYGPGILLATAVGLGCFFLAPILGVVSALMLAILVGIMAGSLRILPGWSRPGIAWASRRLLRMGIVVLGLQLPFSLLTSLGLIGIIVLVATVVATFFGTLVIGRALGVPRVSRHLVATGFAICGASAIAAMSSVVDPTNESEEETAQAITLVTLYGTLALIILPLLQPVTGLDDAAMGLWIGASVHEVAQVVAAASAVGAAALAIATVAKLARVLLLAPLVASVSAIESARARTGQGERPPILPVFVAGFILMAVVRSVVPLPPEVISVAGVTTTILLSIAMFGLGTAVDLRKLVRTGGRVALLAGASTAIAAAVPLGILLVAR
jgi:uncharacterized integral membrane protein (TIGR00698 family)